MRVRGLTLARRVRPVVGKVAAVGLLSLAHCPTLEIVRSRFLLAGLREVESDTSSVSGVVRAVGLSACCRCAVEFAGRASGGGSCLPNGLGSVETGALASCGSSWPSLQGSAHAAVCGWLRIGLPPRRLLAEARQHLKGAILDA